MLYHDCVNGLEMCVLFKLSVHVMCKYIYFKRFLTIFILALTIWSNAASIKSLSQTHFLIFK